MLALKHAECTPGERGAVTWGDGCTLSYATRTDVARPLAQMKLRAVSANAPHDEDVS